MVGPWLFWLGPMIPGHFPTFLWHGIAFLLLALRWLSMIVIGGVLGALWGKGGQVRYLASRWMVTMMKLYDAFSYGLLAGCTAC